jgi:hypothetical protein
MDSEKSSFLIFIYIYTHTQTHTHTFIHKKNLLRVLQCSRILSYAFFRLAFTKIPVNGDPVAFLGPSLSLLSP